MKGNLLVINLGSGCLSEEHLLHSHIEIPSLMRDGSLNLPESINGTIAAVRQRSSSGNLRRILKVGSDAREGLDSTLQTALFVIANRVRWSCRARPPVEQLGRPKARYGCLALLPVGIRPKIVSYSETRRFLDSHWWLGDASGRVVLIPRGFKLLPMPWEQK